MFEKRGKYLSVQPIEVMHNPESFSGSNSYIRPIQLKVASKKVVVTKDGDDSKFDLEAEVRSHPDSLFVKCFAIKANETNDNGDWFGTEELKKAHHTFVGVPAFTNHQNNDVEKARGKVIHSWYDDDKDGIFIISRIDAAAYPELARGIKEEYVVGSSMGVQVEQSICSICHCSATKAVEYCEHIREMKGKKFSGKVKCIYMKTGNGPCPVCGSTKENIKTLEHFDQDVHEKNYGLRFIENSFVVNPACHECGITEVIDTSKFLEKVALLNKRLPGLLKAASSHSLACADTGCVSLINEEDAKTFNDTLGCVNQFAKGLKLVAKAEEIRDGCQKTADSMGKIEKVASEKDIQDLRTAIDLISNVSKKIIDQRQSVDLEFLEDIIQSLSKLVESTDELEQMGFSRLPEIPNSPESPTPVPGIETQIPGTETHAPPVGESKVMTGPTAGGVGTVTGPLASSLLKMVKNAKFRPLNIPLKILQKRGKTPRKLV